jgi:chaperonin GroES
MTSPLQPLGDKVVLQPLEAEKKTAAGLVIPDSAAEKPQEGKVIAVGNGKLGKDGNRIPVEVEVGDVVLYSKYGGTEVKYSNEEYLVVSQSDLLAVVKK